MFDGGKAGGAVYFGNHPPTNEQHRKRAPCVVESTREDAENTPEGNPMRNKLVKSVLEQFISTRFSEVHTAATELLSSVDLRCNIKACFGAFFAWHVAGAPKRFWS